jgi:hypothetical protein
MNILSIFGKNKLAPAWVYKTDGTLWRMLVASDNRIIGENRDTDKRTTSFFCLDGRTGIPHWRDVATIDPWWVGMEAVFGNFLILHGYAQKDLPVHKGIAIIDLATGKQQWFDPDTTFWSVEGDDIIGIREQKNSLKGVVLRLQTGELLRELTEEDVEAMQIKGAISTPHGAADFVLPEVFDPSTAGTQLISIVKKIVEKSPPTGPIETLNVQDRVCINFYCRSTDGSSLTNHFQIFDLAKGSRLYSEILDSSVQQPLMDSYFVRGGLVYFIKNKRELTGVRI